MKMLENCTFSVHVFDAMSLSLFSPNWISQTLFQSRLTWKKRRRTAYIVLVSHIYVDTHLCLRDRVHRLNEAKTRPIPFWCADVGRGVEVNKLQSEENAMK